MTDVPNTVCERLKKIGYAKSGQMRMYGQQFELVSDPIIITESLVVVDAIESKSGSVRRVCIPLPVLTMVQRASKVA